MRPSYRNENRERCEEGRQPARLALFACLGLICHLLIFLSLFLTYIEYFNIYSATDRGSAVCKSQDSAGDFCTILRVMRYTLKRRDRRLAIGEDTCHGESTRTADLAF